MSFSSASPLRTLSMRFSMRTPVWMRSISSDGLLLIFCGFSTSIYVPWYRTGVNPTASWGHSIFLERCSPGSSFPLLWVRGLVVSADGHRTGAAYETDRPNHYPAYSLDSASVLLVGLARMPFIARYGGAQEHSNLFLLLMIYWGAGFGSAVYLNTRKPWSRVVTLRWNLCYRLCPFIGSCNFAGPRIDMTEGSQAQPTLDGPRQSAPTITL